MAEIRFKKPTAAKKLSGKKPLKDITAVMTKKPVRKISEYYYFFNEEMDAKKTAVSGRRKMV